MKRSLARYCVFFTQKNINEMETLNHRIRASIWRSALRFGSSVVGVLPRIVIDFDSTVKTVCSNQQGVSLGYNPHKCVLYISCSQRFARRQRKFFKAGFEGEMSIRAMEWLNLCDNFQPIFRIVPVSCRRQFAKKLLDYLDDRDQDYLIKAKFKGLRLLLETKQWTRIKES